MSPRWSESSYQPLHSGWTSSEGRGCISLSSVQAMTRVLVCHYILKSKINAASSPNIYSGLGRSIYDHLRTLFYLRRSSPYLNSQELVRSCLNDGTLTSLATCEPWPECRTCRRGFSIHPQWNLMILEVEIHALCLVSKGLIGPLVHRGLAVDDTHHLMVTSRTTVACPSDSGRANTRGSQSGRVTTMSVHGLALCSHLDPRALIEGAHRNFKAKFHGLVYRAIRQFLLNGR